jgi:hypothetical protein
MLDNIRGISTTPGMRSTRRQLTPPWNQRLGFIIAGRSDNIWLVSPRRMNYDEEKEVVMLLRTDSISRSFR